PSGPGIRYDGGSYEGWEVPIYYDPLLAKLCVWAETREAAIKRLARALDEYTVEGIRTTLPFFRAVVHNPQFQSGDFDTGFIDDFLSRSSEATRPAGEDGDTPIRDISAIAAVLHAKAIAARQSPQAPQASESRWKLYSRVRQRGL
ncbi:MAG TPA: acetyl-CoA carboxylase biotin carboxylase subunit, partial [Blastocatellia bacterium]|nr:acetyl-CoA carboxylase biotin carboxylase subunit [Blastocatellia bacterium]